VLLSSPGGTSQGNVRENPGKSLGCAWRKKGEKTKGKRKKRRGSPNTWKPAVPGEGLKCSGRGGAGGAEHESCSTVTGSEEKPDRKKGGICAKLEKGPEP